MTPSILIPVKRFDEGKSRLAAVLTSAQRASLCRRLLDHVLTVATDPVLGADVYVVSACEKVRIFAVERGARVHCEQRVGHLLALEDAMRIVPQYRPLLILSADLPGLSVDDLDAMIDAGTTADIVIATDHDGQGTNALLMARPALIPLRFGPGSCAAHQDEAMAAGMTSKIIRRRGLAEDVDLPEHLKILTIGA